MLPADRETFYNELLQSSLVSYPEDHMSELFEENFNVNPAKVNWIFENALKHHDTKIIEFLLFSGLRIGVLNEFNQTALHLAVQYNYMEIIDLLFHYCDNDVNYTDDYGLSHFHVACISGKVDVVSNFLKNGVDVNEKYLLNEKLAMCQGFSALHFSTDQNKLEIAELLLQNGADPNSRDCGGRISLHIACQNSLIKSNDQPGYLMDDNEGVKIVELLLKYKSDVNAKDHYGNTPLHSIFQSDYMREVHFYVPNPDEKQRMIKKMKTERKVKIRCLLENKSDVNACNNGGKTILHLTIGSLKESRKPNVPTDLTFDDDAEVEIVKLILKHKANVNIVNNDGKSPLFIAISMLSKEIVKILLYHHADFNSIKPEFCYADNLVPCLEATQSLIEIVDLLQSRGLKIDRLVNLSVMEFFVRNNANCVYADCKDDFSFDKLSNLLEFGTGSKIVSALDTYPLDIHSTSYKEQIMKKQMVQQITRHIAILANVSLHVTDLVKHSLMSKLERLKNCLLGVMRSDDSLSKDELTTLKLEILKMQSTMLSKSLSLHDFVKSGPVKTYSRLKSSHYKTIVQSQKFSQDFPYTQGIIKGHFAKSLVRRYVTRSSMEYFRSLVGVQLPDLCCEKIFEFLSNESLVEMCLAAES